ncbi:hypothetical protein BN1195_00989 [Chryseobacterium oranimense G311]|nr:hypothetical protein BN1195_00989 [Chryseobacterium oranimense G311]
MNKGYLYMNILNNIYSNTVKTLEQAQSNKPGFICNNEKRKFLSRFTDIILKCLIFFIKMNKN